MVNRVAILWSLKNTNVHAQAEVHKVWQSGSVWQSDIHTVFHTTRMRATLDEVLRIGVLIHDAPARTLSGAMVLAIVKPSESACPDATNKEAEQY